MIRTIEEYLWYVKIMDTIDILIIFVTVLNIIFLLVSFINDNHKDNDGVI
jgi:hypothetical protein